MGVESRRGRGCSKVGRAAVAATHTTAARTVARESVGVSKEGRKKAENVRREGRKEERNK